MILDRKTFVKAGNLLCGFPFPSTESIPLVNDILYSEDFSEVNDDELQSMPSKYFNEIYLCVFTFLWSQVEFMICSLFCRTYFLTRY